MVRQKNQLYALSIWFDSSCNFISGLSYEMHYPFTRIKIKNNVMRVKVSNWFSSTVCYEMRTAQGKWTEVWGESFTILGLRKMFPLNCTRRDWHKPLICWADKCFATFTCGFEGKVTFLLPLVTLGRFRT